MQSLQHLLSLQPCHSSSAWLLCELSPGSRECRATPHWLGKGNACASLGTATAGSYSGNVPLSGEPFPFPFPFKNMLQRRNKLFFLIPGESRRCHRHGTRGFLQQILHMAGAAPASFWKHQYHRLREEKDKCPLSLASMGHAG